MGQTYPVPAPAGSYLRSDHAAKAVTFTGGVYGDDVSQSTANATLDYAPRTQAAKATQLGVSMAVDITAPRGYIAPRDPYSKAQPAAPTITSLAPNTAVAGSPDIVVTVNGTGFTPFTQILNGGVQNVTAYYVSPTRMAMAFEVSSSVAGTVAVVAVDHSVASAASNFTFT